MTTLYVSIARIGNDADYFPVSDDGEALQFYSKRADAKKAAEKLINEYGGDFSILKFIAPVARVSKKKKYKSKTDYEWKRYSSVRPPLGKRVQIKGHDSLGHFEIEDIAWRVKGKMWNWKQSGKIVSVPPNIVIKQWRLLRRKP